MAGQFKNYIAATLRCEALTWGQPASSEAPPPHLLPAHNFIAHRCLGPNLRRLRSTNIVSLLSGTAGAHPPRLHQRPGLSMHSPKPRSMINIFKTTCRCDKDCNGHWSHWGQSLWRDSTGFMRLVRPGLFILFYIPLLIKLTFFVSRRVQPPF